MAATLILWSHARAALLFTALGLWALRRDEDMPPRAALVTALAFTALWALAVAGIGAEEAATRLVELLRNLAWLALLVALHKRSAGRRPPLALATVYGVVALVIIVAPLLYGAARR